MFICLGFQKQLNERPRRHDLAFTPSCFQMCAPAKFCFHQLKLEGWPSNLRMGTLTLGPHATKLAPSPDGLKDHASRALSTPPPYHRHILRIRRYSHIVPSMGRDDHRISATLTQHEAQVPIVLGSPRGLFPCHVLNKMVTGAGICRTLGCRPERLRAFASASES